ncbi:hypothetical protein [Crocosphaera sp.]|uniref:hypothetical protein n=1 Tax=Crocosphaera sp. TaxID=2729996 RepID=UPI002601A114|nr:hypothetical protein [Crocosphaera sp.]MDJ0583228.1 hypothetical protein [Crocosphaera sp.]
MTDLELGLEAESLLPFVQNALTLSTSDLNKLTERLWCFSSSLRQPKKDDASCNKTPLFKRWDTDSKTSHLSSDDPRYCSEQDCKKIIGKLLALLLESHGIDNLPSEAAVIAGSLLNREIKLNSLRCVNTQKKISVNDIKLAIKYTTSRLGKYEIPISYIRELNKGGKHTHSNIGWMKPLHVNYGLRESLKHYLTNNLNINRKTINNVLDKIQVKAYCTDKATIPPYYSNRDFRWATWTNGIQYASHYQCAMIELELMSQLYEFRNAPRLDKNLISEIQKIRQNLILVDGRKCFITGKILNFDEYIDAAVNPKSGKSRYHVGHILPLTRGGKHSYNNIAWVSDDGNRIQGNDTIEEIESKLVDAVEYHLRRDMESVIIPEIFNEKVKTLWHLLNDVREKLGKKKIDW